MKTEKIVDERAMDIVVMLVEQDHVLLHNVREDLRDRVERLVGKRGKERKNSGTLCVDEGALVHRIGEIAGDLHADLGLHLGNVGMLAKAIARQLQSQGFETDPQLCYSGGAMHDVGKLDPIIYELVSFPGKLLPKEKEVTEIHAEMGYKALTKFDLPDRISRFALEHHERLDGTGYPNGLSAEQIDLETRVVTVADAVDAMLQNRPGRKSHDIRYVMRELEKGKGKHFDERVVKAFFEICSRQGYIGKESGKGYRRNERSKIGTQNLISA